MTNKTKIIITVGCIIIIAIVFLFVSQANKQIATERQFIESQKEDAETQISENQESDSVKVTEDNKEPGVIIKNGRELKRDEFGRLVPVERKILEPNKQEIIKSIEMKANMPKKEGEWTIIRKFIKNGQERTTPKSKKFTNGETFEEQFEEMKKILAQDDVVSIGPNYIIKSPKPSLHNLKKVN